MSLPIDLLSAPVLCRFLRFPQRRPSALSPQLKFKATLAAIAVFAILPSIASAQDNWPPDEPNPGVSQQPYSAAPQYSYAPGQTQQSPYGATSQYAAPSQPYASSYPQQGYGQQLGQMQPISPDQLTQLVAPIALYPDGLVAQILAASTYPAQIAAAAQWLRSMGGASPEQIAAGTEAQSSWDPSIKALTAFPQVLEWLASNLQWTTSLGNAYYNQPQDALQTIQVMRQRAEEAGNLQSTPQEEVTENQGAIDIAPTNPQVVYVPTYNPWVVYGQPVTPYPGFSFLGAVDSFFGSSPVQFGLSFLTNAFMHTPWGFLGWGLDWLAHSVLFNQSSYFTHSPSVSDWGFPHGGPRAYPGIPQYVHGGYGASRGWNNYSATMRSGYAHHYGQPSPSYNRPTENFNRNGQGFYGDARTAEGFNRGFAPRTESPVRPAFPPQAAYNRYPQPLARSPQFESRQPAYESRQYAYAGRPGMNFGSPGNQFRAPENNYRGSTGRSFDTYRGNEFARSQPSGGFHLFGNHNSESFGGKAPKPYNYSGGHSGWGGGGWKAPKESHFSSGGGHWGGHSSGGHSSGGGHSGHHH